MKIVDTISFFESLKINTNNKNETQVYDTFVGILSDLHNRNLSAEHLKLVEDKLDELGLKVDIDNKKKYFSRKLNIFEKYLHNNLGLVTEGYYSTLSITLGIAFGATFGVVFDESIGVAYGVSLGVVFGIIIGKLLDLNAEKRKRVLKIKKK